MFNKIKNAFKKKELEPLPEHEHSNEAIVILHLKNGNMDVSVDWTEDLDIRYVGSILGGLATPQIFNLVYKTVAEYLIEMGEQEDLPIIDSVIRDKLHQHHIVTNEGGPVVSPENAVRHQITMYAGQQ